VTRAGIWTLGGLALAALAFVCIRQHAPTLNNDVAAKAPVILAPAKSAVVAAIPAPPVAPTVQAPIVTSAPTQSPEFAVSTNASTQVRANVPAKNAAAVVEKTIAPKSIAQPSAKRVISTKATYKPAKQVRRVGVARKLSNKKSKRFIGYGKAQACDVRASKAALGTICFDFNSARLTPVSKRRLDVLASQIKATEKRVELKGFTDRIGSVQFNNTLAKKRADAVAKYLQMRGVTADKLQATPVGVESGSDLRTHRRVDIQPAAP
jgi:outer membrane protein OmpA-like peptidoglycan-associated protein